MNPIVLETIDNPLIRLSQFQQYHTVKMSPNSEGAWTEHSMAFYWSRTCKMYGSISAPSIKDIEPIVLTSGTQFTFSITSSIFK